MIDTINAIYHGSSTYKIYNHLISKETAQIDRNPLNSLRFYLMLIKQVQWMV